MQILSYKVILSYSAVAIVSFKPPGSHLSTPIYQIMSSHNMDAQSEMKLGAAIDYDWRHTHET